MELFTTKLVNNASTVLHLAENASKVEPMELLTAPHACQD